MKTNKQFILLVAMCIGFVTHSFSQHGRYSITNGIGVQGGLTQYHIITNNFEITKKNGWLAGMVATVDLPHKWYTVSYNIQLSENQWSLLGRSSKLLERDSEAINYKLFAAQIAFLWHLKVVRNYITIDVGPMFQYNSKLALKETSQADYYIANYSNLKAQAITDISRAHVNGAIGVTAGFPEFKLRAQYIYGFTNLFNKLNKQDLDTSGGLNTFKGNQSMIALTAMILF